MTRPRRGPGSAGRRAAGPPGLAALAEGRGGLADAVAQEVELRAADLAVADDLDPLDPRAVDLERALDAHARRDPSDGDRRRDAAVAHPHDEALEHLDALAVALDDLGGDLDRVARGDHRQVGAELVLDDLVDHVHGSGPSVDGRQPRLRDWARISGSGRAKAAGPTAEDSTASGACQAGRACAGRGGAISGARSRPRLRPGARPAAAPPPRSPAGSRAGPAAGRGSGATTRGAA